MFFSNTGENLIAAASAIAASATFLAAAAAACAAALAAAEIRAARSAAARAMAFSKVSIKRKIKKTAKPTRPIFEKKLPHPLFRRPGSSNAPPVVSSRPGAKDPRLVSKFAAPKSRKPIALSSAKSKPTPHRAVFRPLIVALGGAPHTEAEGGAGPDDEEGAVDGEFPDDGAI